MPPRKAPIIPDALLDQLLSGADAKTAFDSNGLLDNLKKALAERVLKAELDHHLTGADRGNRRNGYGKKTVLTDTGAIEVVIPRDRAGAFDAQLLGKHQRRFPGFDDKIVSMYARGMSTREISQHLREIYGLDVSADLISTVADTVIEEVLGLWIEQNEGAKFWLRALNELKSRGVEDILIAVVDSLKGFPEAIAAAYPETTVQTCIVHLLRHSMEFASWEDCKAIATAPKTIYGAVDDKAAEAALTAFEAGPWGRKYEAIGKSWRRAWQEVVPFFAFPRAVRRILYTTNAIDALNAKLRRAVRARGHFPSDDAATKLLFLVLNRSEKEWRMPPREWSEAKAQMAVLFGDRFAKAMVA